MQYVMSTARDLSIETITNDGIHWCCEVAWDHGSCCHPGETNTIADENGPWCLIMINPCKQK